MMMFEFLKHKTKKEEVTQGTLDSAMLEKAQRDISRALEQYSKIHPDDRRQDMNSMADYMTSTSLLYKVPIDVTLKFIKNSDSNSLDILEKKFESLCSFPNRRDDAVSDKHITQEDADELTKYWGLVDSLVLASMASDAEQRARWYKKTPEQLAHQKEMQQMHGLQHTNSNTF